MKSNNKYRNSIIEKKIKKFNKTYFISISLIFILMLFIFVIANIITDDKEFSEIENRNLQNKPKITSENYVEKFNSYVSDQFFSREKFISLKSRVDIILGKNKINDVYIGKDNQLYEDFKIKSKDDLLNKVDVINEFKKQNNDLNVKFILAPTATSIINDKLPKDAPVDDEIE